MKTLVLDNHNHIKMLVKVNPTCLRLWRAKNSHTGFIVVFFLIHIINIDVDSIRNFVKSVNLLSSINNFAKRAIY